MQEEELSQESLEERALQLLPVIFVDDLVIHRLFDLEVWWFLLHGEKRHGNFLCFTLCFSILEFYGRCGRGAGDTRALAAALMRRNCDFFKNCQKLTILISDLNPRRV